MAPRKDVQCKTSKERRPDLHPTLLCARVIAGALVRKIRDKKQHSVGRRETKNCSSSSLENSGKRVKVE